MMNEYISDRMADEQSRGGECWCYPGQPPGWTRKVVGRSQSQPVPKSVGTRIKKKS